MTKTRLLYDAAVLDVVAVTNIVATAVALDVVYFTNVVVAVVATVCCNCPGLI